MSTSAEAQTLLSRLAGPDAVLRDDQATAIATLVDERRRVLLVQRTGWGKSAVYWITTALRRRQGAGPTLVVSPLLALMRDQVAAARSLGLRAETVNSTNPDDWAGILERLDADELDVLLISPERLNAASFRAALAPLAARLGLLVVDEAHCISDWGHDFRPDYRRIKDLLSTLPAGTPVLACTATANERVTEDVAVQLGTDVRTYRGELGRDSLQLAVVDLPDAATRLAWLDAFVRRHRPAHGRAGVVYTLTVDDTDRVATFLAQRGLEVAAYSSAIGTEDRQAVEDDLLANRLDAVVATSALGMGYDKPDLAFVVHLGAPSSPVAYYQQVGRAGRAIDTAEVVLLPTAKDEAIWHHFDLAGIPTATESDALLDALDREEPRSLPALEQRVNARRSRLELLLKVLDVDGAVERVQGGWVSTGTGWVYDEQRYRQLAALRREEHAAMRRLTRGEVDGCFMRFLTGLLDDPSGDACGRCGGCTGWAPDVVVDPDVVAAARDFLRGRDVPVFPRRQWPSGLSEARGRIAADRRAEVGRALAGGDESGWGGTVQALLDASAGGRYDARYEELVTEAVDGIVEVLRRWDWPARPSSIVPVPSRTHDRLLDDVVERIGSVGRLPVVRAVVRRAERPSQSTMSNSAHLAGNALAAYGVLEDVAAGLPPGPVLLVDVSTDSGWTLAAVTWRLRAVHPAPVLPLVLATRP
ncbi:MAG: RecQ family ATP-dependent DNA helicase [Actinobacteria bacterium]|nr:RecQ family ATP-dependent DNA helicase [Actinomycetota bacterium]